MTRLFLLRHAQPACDGLRRYVGQTDVPLGERGRRQAADWGERLRPIDFSRIVSSDLHRARETAEIIAARALRQVETIGALRELHLGAWENRAMSEIRARFPDQYDARGKDLAGFRPPGGESFDDLRRRVVPAVLGIMKAASGDVLAVAHAGVNRVLLCDLLGIPLQRLFSLGQDPAGMNLIDFRPDGPRVALINMPPPATGWPAAEAAEAPYRNRIQH